MEEKGVGTGNRGEGKREDIGKRGRENKGKESGRGDRRMFRGGKVGMIGKVGEIAEGI